MGFLNSENEEGGRGVQRVTTQVLDKETKEEGGEAASAILNNVVPSFTPLFTALLKKTLRIGMRLFCGLLIIS